MPQDLSDYQQVPDAMLTKIYGVTRPQWVNTRSWECYKQNDHFVNLSAAEIEIFWAK